MKNEIKKNTRSVCNGSPAKIRFVAGSYSEPGPLKQYNKALYDESYTDSYELFYLHPWMKKHLLNIAYIKSILTTLFFDQIRWLDLCCGQAWHFSALKHSPLDNQLIDQLGVDLSTPQLKRAELRNPDAKFIAADVLNVSLPRHEFALVTSFWGAYCYLNSHAIIKTFLKRAIDWTRTGGAFYLEVLTGDKLLSFNKSPYAAQTGFQVTPVNEDCSEWIFEDTGGFHYMTSPTIDFFIDIVSPYFTRVEAQQDAGFMTHLICTGKRDPD